MLTTTFALYMHELNSCGYHNYVPFALSPGYTLGRGTLFHVSIGEDPYMRL